MKSWRTTGTLFALSVCAWPCCLACADDSILQHISEDPESSALVSDFRQSHRVKRYAIVIVDVQSLRETIAEFEQPGREETCCTLFFQVFPDVGVALHTYRVSAEYLKPWYWAGIDSVNGDESVIASLTIDFGERIIGSFNGLGGRIRIEPLDGRGTHIIWELEPFEQRID